MLLNIHSSRKLSEKVLHTPLSARPTAVCYRFVAGKAHLLSHASVNLPVLQVALSVLQATSYTWLAEGGLRTHRHSFLFTPQNHHKHSICKSKNLTWGTHVTQMAPCSLLWGTEATVRFQTRRQLKRVVMNRPKSNDGGEDRCEVFKVGVFKKPSPMITFLHTRGNARVGWVLSDTVWRREGGRNPTAGCQWKRNFHSTRERGSGFSRWCKGCKILELPWFSALI